jgi:hypothetical protein
MTYQTGFSFVGYDLADVESSVSALTNAADFPRLAQKVSVDQRPYPVL